jgi:hypothetical protein
MLVATTIIVMVIGITIPIEFLTRKSPAEYSAGLFLVSVCLRFHFRGNFHWLLAEACESSHPFSLFGAPSFGCNESSKTQIAQWDKHIQVTKIVFVVQSVVFFQEPERSESFYQVSFRHMHEIVRVFIAGEIQHTAQRGSPEDVPMCQPLEQGEERHMQANHHGEGIPAQCDMGWNTGASCLEFTIPMVQLMVNQRVPLERLLKGEGALDVHQMPVDKPLEIAAIDEQDQKSQALLRPIHIVAFPDARCMTRWCFIKVLYQEFACLSNK